MKRRDGRAARRWPRRLARAAGTLAALMLVAALGVWASLDTLARLGVERYGSATLGARLRVARAAASLRGGSLTLDGVEVANPRGFSRQPALGSRRRNWSRPSRG